MLILRQKGHGKSAPHMVTRASYATGIIIWSMCAEARTCIKLWTMTTSLVAQCLMPCVLPMTPNKISNVPWVIRESNGPSALIIIVYDELLDTWVKQRSRHQPFVNVMAKMISEDYAALRFHLKRDNITRNGQHRMPQQTRGLEIHPSPWFTRVWPHTRQMQMHTATWWYQDPYGDCPPLGQYRRDRQCCGNQTDDIRHKLFRLKLFLSRD